MTSFKNEFILNYNDACIYKSDLRLFESRKEWLNDACINYQMTRIAKTLTEKNETQIQNNSKEGKDDITNISTEMATVSNSNVNNDESIKIAHVHFIDPSVVSFFMHQLSINDEDDIDEMISLCQGWGIQNDVKPIKDDERSIKLSATMLIVPINDNHSASSISFQTPGGGSHWSLLVVLSFNIDVPAGTSETDNLRNLSLTFFHFDSSFGYNTSTARSVAEKIHAMVFIQHSKLKKTNNLLKITECNVPQQQNGYDCGVHTLATVNVISKAQNIVIRGGSKEIHNLQNEIKCYFESLVRGFMLRFESVTIMASTIKKSIVKDIHEMAAIASA